MGDIDRKAIENYFKPFPTWTIWFILIGIVLVLIGFKTTIGVSGIGVIFLAIGIIPLAKQTKPSDEQMDQWWQQEIQALLSKALGKVGFDPSDCVAEPVVVWGPRVENSGGVPLQLKKGNDGIVRYNPADVSILNFGEHQLVSYQSSYDRFTGNALQETTDEYFYKDVVSVSTKTDTTSRDVTVGKNKLKIRVQLKNSETFRLTTSGGTSIEVFLKDDALLKTTNGGNLLTTQAEQAVQSVRRMLRDKKAN